MAYAVRVLHSDRERFEKQQGWTIKRMDKIEQSPVHEDDYAPEDLEPSPTQDEYAPVIFAQDTISHVVSLDMLSGVVRSFLIFWNLVMSVRFQLSCAGPKWTICRQIIFSLQSFSLILILLVEIGG